MNLDVLNRYLSPIKRRIQLMLGRALITALDDSGGLQRLQLKILADESHEGVDRVQEYGFTSHPKQGAEAFVAFLGGARDHGVVIAVDDRRYRLKGLEEGEVALYTDEGDKIHFKRGRIIEIVTNTLKITAATKVEINTPQITASGTFEAAGDITSETEVADANGPMSEMRSIYNGHVHGGSPTPTPTMD